MTTPGPWFVYWSQSEDTWTVQHGGGWIARVLDVEPQRPGEANARLIAASPELLEALKQACRILADEDVPDAALHPGDPLLVWKAAIAKAEGKS